MVSLQKEAAVTKQPRKNMKKNFSGPVECPVCGLTYVKGYTRDEHRHNEIHEKFLTAAAKYTYIYPYGVREQMKADAWPILLNKDEPFAMRCEAAEEILKAHFARSVSANRYSLKHPTYPEYAAMQLNDVEGFAKFGADVYSALLAKYGTKEGIEKGSSVYQC